MLKPLFRKWFAEAIKPFAKRLSDVEEIVNGDEFFVDQKQSQQMKDRDAAIMELGARAREIDDAKRARKPLIAKADALKNLKEYEDGYRAHRAQQPNNRNVGSEIEFYERNNKELKREELRGVEKIDAFIERAKKDEVRLVRQVR